MVSSRNIHEQGYDFGIELTNEQFYKYILKKPLPTMDKKIISYELIKLYPGCNFKIGETINGLSLAKELKLADFPEFWKPHYAPTSQTITVVPGLEVVITDGKLFYKYENITEAFLDAYEHYSEVIGHLTFGNKYPVVVKDIKFSKFGCQDIEAMFSDWTKVLEAINQFKK